MKFYLKSYHLLLVILCGLIFSQESNEPFFDKKIGKEYFIQFSEFRPQIDGKLDDPLWNRVVPVNDFLQEYPENMENPSEKTEVYLSYNDQSLFIAARLFDSESELIKQQLAARDDWYNGFDEIADWFSISFDSRHDHQTAYTFAVNASGILYDEMVYHDQNYDEDWDAIWEAEVAIDEFGWVVEMEIPFSNLPFYGGQDMVWGFNILRFIQRKYETIAWVTFPLDVEGIVSKYGHLVGLRGIYPPAKFEFKPYSLSRITKYSDIRLLDYEIANSHGLNYRDQWNYNLGLDLLYRINTNSKFTFTLNPDFGQVESDPSDVNLTAFETYFQEKRPFFMKDMDIFQTPIEMFYSRRIGETAWSEGELIQTKTLNNIIQSECDYYEGTYSNSQCTYIDTSLFDKPLMIKGAGKITGRTESGFSYGIIGAVATYDDSSSWMKQMEYGSNRGYLVSRFKKDLFSGNSFFGLMSTSSFIDSSHLVSIDGMGNFLDNQIGLEGQYILDIKKENYDGAYVSLSFSPPGKFSGWFDYYNYSKGLNINDLGYLWRDDYIQSKLGFKFQSLEQWKMINDYYIIVEADAEKNSNDVDLGKTLQFITDIELSNYWVVGGSYLKIFEHYDDRKIFYDYDNSKFGPIIFIPEIDEYNLNISSNKSFNLSTSIALTWAKNAINDKENSQFIEITYKPNSFLTFSTSYERYRLKKKNNWIESFYDCYEAGTAVEPIGVCDYHHIFSDLNRKIDIMTIKASGNYSKKISLLSYFEIYSNRDAYHPDSYLEYLPNSRSYEKTDYILGQADWVSEDGNFMPVYTQDMDEYDAELSYLDPNLYLGLYPNYTSMIFNSIIKWNYIKGSNIYFIFSFNKSINGKPFSSLNKLNEFISYNEKRDWIEVLRDQTFMIKIDYWFEK